MQKIRFSDVFVPGFALVGTFTALCYAGSNCWVTVTDQTCCARPGSGYVAQHGPCGLVANCPDLILEDAGPVNRALSAPYGLDRKDDEDDRLCQFLQRACNSTTGLCDDITVKNYTCVNSSAAGYSCSP